MSNNKFYRNNFSVYYIISSIYNKIEIKLFVALSILLLILGFASKDFENKVSMFFVNITLPVMEVASYPLNYLSSASSNFKDLIKSREINNLLKKDNENLKQQLLESLKIKEENQYLKDLANYVSLRSSKNKSSRIIGRSNKIYSDSIFVEVGSNHGIKQDSAVVGKYAMIGRISQVGENQSRILLPTDINSHLPIITSRSKNRGILKGRGDEIMEILYLDKDHGLKEGDMIFTSGDGDSLPYGILVGKVVAIKGEKIYAKMVEDVNRVYIVSVIDY